MIVAGNRRIGLLWTSTLRWNLGTCLMIVTLAVYVYTTTGSTLSSASTFVAQTLPAIVSALLAGVLVDRWDRLWPVIGVLTGGMVLAALLPPARPGPLAEAPQTETMAARAEAGDDG
ncbi:hypothetical protein ACGFIR_14740 [Micromonospora sp. NPDC049051]|uniref:hypothetical protein n=1 Tax=Micromonospora sp. NPDC049051 TaxID=3364264 RepID=UPI00370F9B3F